MKLRKICGNKKASTLDNIFLLVKIFGFAFFVLIMFLIWAEFTTDRLNSELWDKSSIGSSIRNNTTVAIDNMDWIFLVAYFGLHIGIIILAYMLRSHPVVYIAGIFIIIILIMISAPLSNVWNEVLTESVFSSTVSKVSKTSFIMDRLPLFECIFGFITLLAFAAFAKSEQLF